MGRDSLQELRRVVDELVKKGAPVNLETLAELATKVSDAFNVRSEEVAILALDRKGQFLQFVVPEKLQNIGTVPLTSTGALAVRTVREKRPEIINNFPLMRHVSFFEAVPLNGETAHPIQKIMSAPLIVGNKVVGVIQISRKGKNVASAGPDFTQKDLTDLVMIANLLGSCLKLYAGA